MAKQAGKGVEEFRPYVTRVIPVVCFLFGMLHDKSSYCAF